MNVNPESASLTYPSPLKIIGLQPFVGRWSPTYVSFHTHDTPTTTWLIYGDVSPSQITIFQLWGANALHYSKISVWRENLIPIYNAAISNQSRKRKQKTQKDKRHHADPGDTLFLCTYLFTWQTPQEHSKNTLPTIVGHPITHKPSTLWTSNASQFAAMAKRRSEVILHHTNSALVKASKFSVTKGEVRNLFLPFTTGQKCNPVSAAPLEHLADTRLHFVPQNYDQETNWGFTSQSNSWWCCHHQLP